MIIDPYGTPAAIAGGEALKSLLPHSEGWTEFHRRQVAAAVIAATNCDRPSMDEWLSSNVAFEIAWRGARTCSVGELSPARLTAALNALADSTRPKESVIA